ncbi:MAG TPA: hypothetical protein VN193_03755 [Candidatus Angelobacter sp.]|nr:hypothetical protein [Candidatus Angelobacter sp.]
MPTGPRTGGHLARGVVIYIGATSVLSGLITVVGGNNVGAGLAAAIFGVAFAVTFFVAMMLRPGAGIDAVRSALGVVSVLFLVACFVLAITATDSGPTEPRTQLIRAAAAAGLFTFGMVGVAVLIPSAVAAGLAMLGLVGTVELACGAAGVEVFGFAVAGLLAGVVALEIAFRVPGLRRHPSAPAWMVNVAAVLVGAAATGLGVSFQGTALAATGLTGLALVLVAWRWHAVVAAVVAVWPLSLVEGYVIVSAVGGDTTTQGVIVLLVGLVVLLVVAVLGLRSRGRPREASRRPVLVDELVLVAAAVFALVALSQVGTASPFRTSPFGRPSPLVQPTFPPLLTPEPFPTFSTG